MGSPFLWQDVQHPRLTLSGRVCVCVCEHVLAAKSCPTLCHPLVCSPPGSSVRAIFQASIWEKRAILFSRGIFPDPGMDPGSPTLQILYHVSHQGNAKKGRGTPNFGTKQTFTVYSKCPLGGSPSLSASSPRPHHLWTLGDRAPYSLRPRHLPGEDLAAPLAAQPGFPPAFAAPLLA